MQLDYSVRVAFTFSIDYTYYNLLGTFFPMVFMLIMVYNSSLRSNYAYMVFAVLTWQTLADTENE